MNWNVPGILQFAVWAIVGLLCLLYKYHEDRLRTLETTRQNKADADVQRAELREELKDFREEVETMRVETNTKLDKLFDQIAALASTYAKASRR